MTERREAERRALVRAFTDYQNLRTKDRARPASERMILPPLLLVAVRCAAETLDLDEATDRVGAAVNNGQGWARLRSGLARAGVYPGDQGEPLYADWALDATTSCRLRIVSGSASYAARLWTFTERRLQPGDALADDELPALREVRRMPAQGMGAQIRALIHHVYWGAAPHDDVHALARRFDRFAGFQHRSTP